MALSCVSKGGETIENCKPIDINTFLCDVTINVFVSNSFYDYFDVNGKKSIQSKENHATITLAEGPMQKLVIVVIIREHLKPNSIDFGSIVD